VPAWEHQHRKGQARSRGLAEPAALVPVAESGALYLMGSAAGMAGGPRWRALGSSRTWFAVHAVATVCILPVAALVLSYLTVTVTHSLSSSDPSLPRTRNSTSN
jgi:hypothetical protein